MTRKSNNHKKGGSRAFTGSGDFRPKKNLGQNFLNDMNIVRKILFVAETSGNDAVIEVGPGLGIMTRELAGSAGLVVAVEIDKSLMPRLQPLAEEFPNVRLINRDILKTDVRRDIIDAFVSGSAGASGQPLDKVKVVANLPYYITTPIIMKFLEDNSGDVDSMVIMVQKEVAERMVASPGGKDYGAMTVTVNYYSVPEIQFIVPPSCFTPRPGVDSAVIRLTMRKTPPFELKDEKYFFDVVRAAFSQRRKTLANALANAPCVGVPREAVSQALEALGKDPLARGETLSPREFGELSNRLWESRDRGA
ncbi:MAG: 16S rRNA (adenine(1518)-N(6)/adenine(1519)-N(6))-dimethyltransferase RsmA [Clostridia bacterium]|nr:16S rRNA (adenine(1518)-N(6)/adenine(1519)-N(6))-dimethyltransferase RsmA [Clostridia bacterium]